MLEQSRNHPRLISSLLIKNTREGRKESGRGYGHMKMIETELNDERERERERRIERNSGNELKEC